LRAGEMSRDKNRTPMQWSNNPNAGFSPHNVETWLPVNPNYRNGINVRDQQHNPSSLLNYYKTPPANAQRVSGFDRGRIYSTAQHCKGLSCFVRKSEDQTILVILNFSEKKLDLDFSRTREIKAAACRSCFPAPNG